MKDEKLKELCGKLEMKTSLSFYTVSYRATNTGIIFDIYFIDPLSSISEAFSDETQELQINVVYHKDNTFTVDLFNNILYFEEIIGGNLKDTSLFKELIKGVETITGYTYRS